MSHILVWGEKIGQIKYASWWYMLWRRIKGRSEGILGKGLWLLAHGAARDVKRREYLRDDLEEVGEDLYCVWRICSRQKVRKIWRRWSSRAIIFQEKYDYVGWTGWTGERAVEDEAAEAIGSCWWSDYIAFCNHELAFQLEDSEQRNYIMRFIFLKD